MCLFTLLLRADECKIGSSNGQLVTAIEDAGNFLMGTLTRL
jgi:hypothetical protein